MIGVIIAAHAELADAFLNTAKAVTQFDGKARAIGVVEGDTTSSYEERLRQAVAEVRGNSGVLVLTDMFGGTPSNVGMTMHDSSEVEVLTGANLPMMIKALQLSTTEESLAEVARQVKGAGLRAIAVASDVLGGAST